MKNLHRFILILLFIAISLHTTAQTTYTLEDCRQMALQNNKQLNVSRIKQDVAENTRKAARTLYLPRVNAIGSYQFTSREFSLLNNKQKNTLSNLGSSIVNPVTNSATDLITQMVTRGILSPQIGEALAAQLQNAGGRLADLGNSIGKRIKDAFRTDSRNLWAGTVMVSQPLYMGGAISAANRMADINEQLMEEDLEMHRQATIYDIEKTYWTIVALAGKQRLALSYEQLVKKLSEDVHKMINEGVATRADGLKVDVKVNEAAMQVTQVENGLSLAKMLLCQLCGLPVESDIRLADENEPTDDINFQEASKEVDSTNTSQPRMHASHHTTQLSLYDTLTYNRPELRMMQYGINISKESTNLIRASYRPKVVLTGGYIITNPNLFNGFERKFGGMWNVGVTASIPIWSWHEGRYKINASKAATKISEMELEDLNEKIQLQVAQENFKVKEAMKKLATTEENIKSAEENLRCANLGFREGVIDATDVMAAQTAWQQAKSQQIDAEVELRLAQVGLKKAKGVL